MHKLLILTILFLFVRTVGLGSDIANSDATRWHRRTENFISAIANFDFASTYQHYQPGVTLMWVSIPAKHFVYKGLLEHADYFPTINMVGQASIVGVLTILFAAQLFALRKLYGEKTAVIYGSLLALEPYLIGVDRWYHVTSLEIYFGFTAFLALLLWLKDQNRKLLLLSAALLSLSVLAKFTSLILLPLFVFIIFRTNKKRLVEFLLVFLLSLFVLFPALWVAPLTVFQNVKEALLGAVTNEIRGESVILPGSFYYAAILLFKLSPLTLLFFGLAMLKKIKASYVFAYLGIYYLFLSVAGQKIDRYALVFIPPIILIVSLYLSELSFKKLSVCLFGVLLFFVYVAHIYHPVYSAYYSPILDGFNGAMKVQVYDNSGEYFAQTASYLNSIGPDAVVYVPDNIESFLFYFKGTVVREFNPDVDYVIRSVDWNRRQVWDENCPQIEKIFGPSNISIVTIFKCEKAATAGVILGHVYWNGKFSERSIRRLEEGIKIFKQYKVDYLITTGGAGLFNDSEIPMGVLMKDYLVTRGVPQDKVFVEQTSMNTDENALGALEILKAHDIKDVVIITSADHMTRAKLIFQDIFPDDYKLNYAISDYFIGAWSIWDFVWHIGGWGKYFLAKLI